MQTAGRVGLRGLIYISDLAQITSDPVINDSTQMPAVPKDVTGLILSKKEN
jgi:hypothetical protein